MQQNTIRQQLNTISKILIDPDSELGDWIASLGKLEQLLLDLSPLSFSMNDITAGESFTDSGWAISPTQAAFCLREYARSTTFIKGLVAAISDLVASSVEPVHILYAGCGPFALLALPIAATFPAAKVKFSVLDLHAESLKSVQSIFSSFGLSGSIDEFVQADASVYAVPDPAKFHIVLTETMNVALTREPQLPISRNLITQIPDAILIPENIKIDAALINVSKEHVMVEHDHVGPIPKPDRDRIFLGTIFALDKSAILAWADMTDSYLPARSASFPAYGSQYDPVLLTTITCYKDFVLGDYSTSLTLPYRFSERNLSLAGQTVQFQYDLGSNPGFSIKN